MDAHDHTTNTALSGTPHFHRDERGILVRCYHRTKPLHALLWFLLGTTVTYPLEHLLWEGWLLHHWPFSLLHELLGH